MARIAQIMSTTGCEFLDKLIGKLESDVVTTVYGPSGSGKTNTCMLVAAEVARKKGKVVYIDTEGGFSTERFKQITGDEFSTILGRILFIKPTSFAEQKKALEKLKEKVTSDIKLVVMDTIAMLYRLELGKGDDVFEANRELGRQLSYLTEIARKLKIPVLITNQVYSNIENGCGVKMVGGDMMVYGSKCLIEIVKGHNSMRKAVLRKHRSMEENKEINFKITQEGLSCSN